MDCLDYIIGFKDIDSCGLLILFKITKKVKNRADKNSGFILVYNNRIQIIFNISVGL